jgi:hypothetical protein
MEDDGKQIFKKRFGSLNGFFISVICKKKNVDQGKAFTVVALETGFFIDWFAWYERVTQA